MKSKSKIAGLIKNLTLALFVLMLASAGTKNDNFEVLNSIEQNQVKDLPTQVNEAFKPGEILTYRLHYGAMDAAIAVMEVEPEIKQMGNHECYHIVGKGNSKGTFDWFFKVRDRYETYLDKDALVPWYFVRRCYEGGYNISQDYIFNHYINKVDVGKGETYSFPQGTQDIISAFYSARNLNFEKAKEGDVYSLNCFLDKENWPLRIKYIGRETIETDIGKVRCLKFRPIVQKGRVFKKDEDLNVWISDDKNHIPIRAQAKVLIGSIKMDITDYKNTANPMAIEK